jgi:hypothetical protein
MKRKGALLFLATGLVLLGPAMAVAQGGPRGGGPPGGAEPGPPVPATLTVQVDCAAGDSIAAALARPATKLTIEISGLCTEDVVIRREQVTLRGTDPSADGLRGVGPGTLPADGVLRIVGTRAVRIENLALLGGARNGLAVVQSLGVTVINCRISDNARIGVTASGTSFVDMADTAVHDNLAGGLAAFDSSVIGCRRCTISGGDNVALATRSSEIEIVDGTLSGRNQGLVANVGAVIYANRSALSASREALFAGDLGEISVTGGTLSGAIVGQGKSLVVLDGVQQAAGTWDNVLKLDSTAQVTGSSSLSGRLSMMGVSNLLLEAGSMLAGDLSCASGSNAFCEDPAGVSGTVTGCTGCVKPPPCVPTTGSEYILSGGSDPSAGIFVDDFLRVTVDGAQVAEVQQGGRCCTPASPIRFTASTGGSLTVVAQDGNDCYSLEKLYLQKADGSCLTELTSGIFGPSCGQEPPGQIFFNQTFTLP